MRAADLARQTDLCVKCGLCLPHCPTYLKTLDENESPRGRLSLIQGWARSELEADQTLKRHIDQCLLCRACETVCPAYVPYGEIVDRFKGGTSHQPLAHSFVSRSRTFLIRKALDRAPGGDLEARLLAAGQSSLLRRLARWMGFGGLMEGLPKPSPWPQTSAPEGPGTEPAAEVQLFLGCTAGLMDRETMQSILLIFEYLGIPVSIPSDQTCCGALDQHHGKTDRAQKAIRQNIAAFSSSPKTTPIVSFASGCGAMLSDYERVLNEEGATAFSQRFRDISTFLRATSWPEDALRPLDQTVCLHAPCSLKNVLHQEQGAFEILKRIPQLKVVNLASKTKCCGAAGTYMIDHPEMAKELQEDVLEAILETGASAFLTSNPGCATHLRSGLEARGRGDIEVLHPVTLLARQLRNT